MNRRLLNRRGNAQKGKLLGKHELRAAILKKEVEELGVRIAANAKLVGGVLVNIAFWIRQNSRHLWLPSQNRHETNLHLGKVNADKNLILALGFLQKLKSSLPIVILLGQHDLVGLDLLTLELLKSTCESHIYPFG